MFDVLKHTKPHASNCCIWELAQCQTKLPCAHMLFILKRGLLRATCLFETFSVEM